MNVVFLLLVVRDGLVNWPKKLKKKKGKKRKIERKKEKKKRISKRVQIKRSTLFRTDSVVFLDE